MVCLSDADQGWSLDVKMHPCRFERSELQRITFQAHSETRSTLLQALVVNLADPETCVRRSAVLTSAGLWHRLGHG